MKGKELFSVLGEIDDTFICEAKLKNCNKINLHKMSIIAAVVCILSTGVALAAATVYQKAFNRSISYADNELSSYEELTSAYSSLDFVPNIPEELSVGAKFVKGNLINNQNVENGNIVDESISIFADYQIDNKNISLMCDKSSEVNLRRLYETTDIFNINGINVLYKEQTVLLKPFAMEKNKLLASWSSELKNGAVIMSTDQVREPLLQYKKEMVWQKDGVRYTLSNIGESKEAVLETDKMLEIIKDFE